MRAWLLRLRLNPRCHRVFSGAVLDGQELYRDLMRLAPDDLGEQHRKEAGVLFRCEADQRGFVVLAQLRFPPRLERLPEELATEVRQRELTPLLERLERGTRVRYRIDANPTKRNGDLVEDKGKRGKLTVLRGTESELWWVRKAGEAGLHPLEIRSTPMPDVLGREYRKRGASERVKHGVSRFEGVGMVTDPDALRAAVIDGIGRARTFGCGMLSVGPEERG
ncbi:CRISPR system Cascade subunit CasE [Actinopolyspora lacussalsi]|nr:CRISPR system Cascade subunit CasE [Actinopolyspora lacussalsi]